VAQTAGGFRHSLGIRFLQAEPQKTVLYGGGIITFQIQVGILVRTTADGNTIYTGIAGVL
jgi:hypothetical protein